ncbi:MULTISPECIES: hypothetical protein [unclassified Kitasatospora]|uniref:hypothetical protein n=1 Tax=unclassified Kitasatospora TaxID=2633591 RepID=UPI00053B1C42|nr:MULTISPECIES: hypothetical protein [unclassified Kitasatospora]
MTRTTTPKTTPDALMSLLLEQRLVRTATAASDGSWLVRRTTHGPKVVLEGPVEVMDYGLGVLLDAKLDLEDIAA